MSDFGSLTLSFRKPSRICRIEERGGGAIWLPMQSPKGLEKEHPFSARNASKPKWVKIETEGRWSRDCRGNNQLGNPLGYLKTYQ